jgi:hypothetical protein
LHKKFFKNTNGNKCTGENDRNMSNLHIEAFCVGKNRGNNGLFIRKKL